MHYPAPVGGANAFSSGIHYTPKNALPVFSYRRRVDSPEIRAASFISTALPRESPVSRRQALFPAPAAFANQPMRLHQPPYLATFIWHVYGAPALQSVLSQRANKRSSRQQPKGR